MIVTRGEFDKTKKVYRVELAEKRQRQVNRFGPLKFYNLECSERECPQFIKDWFTDPYITVEEEIDTPVRKLRVGSYTINQQGEPIYRYVTGHSPDKSDNNKDL